MYNSYLGSMDIDIVGPSLRGSFDYVIERYEEIHQYERVDRDLLGLEYVYRKPILRGPSRLGYVEIDACSFEADTGRFHEDSDKSLPYGLCSDRRLVREVSLDGDTVCFIPGKSLLFLYKVKAERDRSYDLKTSGAVMSAERRNWLEAKRSKDQSDLVALLDPEPKRYVVAERIDCELVKRIVKDRRLAFIYESISLLPKRAEAIRRYGMFKNVNTREIEEWVEPLLP